MRMDSSVLLLCTPRMPPTAREPGFGSGGRWPPDLKTGEGCDARPRGAGVDGPDPGVDDPPDPGVVPGPCTITWKSSFVIGSLNFLRRSCSSTSTSSVGGSVPGPCLRWNRLMARTYCWPRKTSSASFSRCVYFFQTG